MTWNISTFQNNDILAETLAKEIAKILEDAIAEKGEAAIALSGGSTPKKLLIQLSKKSLPWEKVTVTLVDERWVDESHSDSNAALIKNFLLQGKAEKAKYLPLKSDFETPYLAENETDTLLKTLPSPLDVVVLGMGNDGHTASFFPLAKTLGKALDLKNQKHCCALTPPAAAHERMTLTLSYLRSANKIFLHIVGSEKWQVLQEAISKGPVEDLPIRAFLHDSVTTSVYYADS